MKKILVMVSIITVLILAISVVIYATPDVSKAIENTWDATKVQIKAIVNNVVFPVLNVILAVFFFIKLGTAYFDYRKQGQFEWAAPVILFACLVFTLTAPTYLWSIIGM